MEILNYSKAEQSGYVIAFYTVDGFFESFSTSVFSTIEEAEAMIEKMDQNRSKYKVFEIAAIN